MAAEPARRGRTRGVKKELEIKRERRQAEHGTLHCLSVNLLRDLCPRPRARVPAAAGVVAMESGKHGETDGAISPLTCPWMGCGKDSYLRSATVQLHRHTCCSTELTTLSETPLVGQVLRRPPAAHLLLEAVLYQNVLLEHDLWNGARREPRAQAEDAGDV